jgi:hypothetical protein
MPEIVLRPVIAAMSPHAIDVVRSLETELLALPQLPMETHHVLHAGLYARTWHIPAGSIVTGVLVKIATVLIVQGDAVLYVGTGDDMEAIGHRHLTGYSVLAGAAGRKQALVARSDVHATMIFPSRARTVEEAEAEFTDETGLLGSRRVDSINTIVITGD